MSDASTTGSEREAASDALAPADSGVALQAFLISRGAPFYELQNRLGLLREHSLHAGARALGFVALAWGVPFVLSVMAGKAFGPFEQMPFALDLGVWARFFLAIGLMVLMERQLERGLSAKLTQFVRAPLIAPESMRDAALAVNRALARRDSVTAELVCLALAVLVSIASLINQQGDGSHSWLASGSGADASLSLAGWWCLLVSSPIFWFLLFRAFWRHFIWAMLLIALSRLKLRLVASHPDGRGGLGFIGEYPNAYTMFVFAMSCVVAATIAGELLHDRLSVTVYMSLLGAWLAIVLAFFALPLTAFVRPLFELKQQTQLVTSAQATQFLRLAERKLLGANVVAPDPSEEDALAGACDPSALFDKNRKVSLFLLNRSVLVPVCAAAVLPLAAAGVTKMPYKEMLSVAKGLLLL